MVLYGLETANIKHVSFPIYLQSPSSAKQYNTDVARDTLLTCTTSFASFDNAQTLEGYYDSGQPWALAHSTTFQCPPPVAYLITCASHGQC